MARASCWTASTARPASSPSPAITVTNPASARPHRVHLRAESWDAADLEAELMPTLRRNTNLIARALGRPMVTDWLRERNLDGTVQIDDLLVGGEHLENFRARVLWDVARVQLDAIQASLGSAPSSPEGSM